MQQQSDSHSAVENKNILLRFHNEYRKNKSIKKSKLLDNLPKNLKTNAKMEYINKLGRNITEKEFVGLLLYQTQGADWVNLYYLIKYYNLQLDDNKMIIFTKEFPYSSIKQEALYIWWIMNYVYSHPLLSKYINTQLSFQMQERLEIGIFPTSDNFKYDHIFDKIKIALEVNEQHHNTNKQKLIDEKKKSLCKLHGIILMTISTNDAINYEKHKYNVFTKALENNAIITDLLNRVCENLARKSAWYTGSGSNLHKCIKSLLLLYIRKRAGRQPTIQIKNDLDYFKRLDVYHDEIDDECEYVVDEYIDNELNNKLAESCKNSKYLYEFQIEYFNNVLSALLKDFNFRQDYITKVFVETLVDSQINILDYSKKNIKKFNTIEKRFINMEFNNAKLVLLNFNESNNEFLKLFEFKTRSLQNSNNSKNIKFKEIIELFKIKTNEVLNFRQNINYICKIDPNSNNDDVMFSWLDINDIINKYEDLELEFSKILQLYYKHLDVMYENIINRMKAYHETIVSTSSDFYNYQTRVVEKYNKKITDKIVNVIKYINDTNGMDIITASNLIEKLKKLKINDNLPTVNIIDNSVNEQTIYNKSDFEKIARDNIADRIEVINNEFEVLIASVENIKEVKNEQTIIYISDSDAESESDVDI